MNATTQTLPRPKNNRKPGGMKASWKQGQFLDIWFNNCDLNEALELVEQALNNGRQSSLFFVNAHCVNVSFEHAEYHRALTSADLVFPDGSGIALGCKANSHSLKENLNGTDVFPALCQQFARQNRTVFLVGTNDATLSKVTQTLHTSFPGISVVGSHHGFFPLTNCDDVVSAINDSGAEILVVAMGVPKQELFVAQNKHRLNTKLNIAVGGCLDFIAGNVSRAPLWLRKCGMEWMWRLQQEPIRLWRRYVLGNPLFVFRLGLDRQAKKFQQRCWQHFNLHRHWLQIRALWIRWQFRQDYTNWAKRSLDIAVSSVALLILSPLLATVAVLIKAQDRGPVFYYQQRVGRYGRLFSMWKFRSMSETADQQCQALQAQNHIQGNVLFKLKGDPRITPVGKWLRKLSLDELPQLWNVLKGDMSLVGPRPGLAKEVEQYRWQQRQRLDTRPGITSLWAVSGRSDIPFEQQAEMDLDYVHRRSFLGDLWLLLKTIPAIISGRGAY